VLHILKCCVWWVVFRNDENVSLKILFLRGLVKLYAHIWARMLIKHEWDFVDRGLLWFVALSDFNISICMSRKDGGFEGWPMRRIQNGGFARFQFHFLQQLCACICPSWDCIYIKYVGHHVCYGIICLIIISKICILSC